MKNRPSYIDINCDLGEGIGNEEAILPFISSANISCGLHAGDTDTIRQTIESCLLHNVRIGAHPSFDDRQNFGRTEIRLPHKELYELVRGQISFMYDVTKSCGGKLVHVKPHGTLYTMAAGDPEMSATIVKAVIDFDDRLILFGLSGSHLVHEAEKAGLTVMNEVFADRTYREDGQLTPRSDPNALIVHAREAVKQVLQMLIYNTVTSTTGKDISITADTICIHGDGKYAVEFAKEIYGALSDEGIQISKATPA